MKKILSILLCLVMALGLAVPAMAEGYTAGTYTASPVRPLFRLAADQQRPRDG